MAVTKIIPIRATIGQSIDYIMSPNKTENCVFVSSENCIPETAVVEFQLILDRAHVGGNTIGRHLIQSFKPGEVTAAQAHEIGKKLASEILAGQYTYVLATHLNRDHYHNHFVWCTVNMETHKRYVSNRASYRKIQDASNRLCAEYKLLVIIEKSGRRDKSYTEYQADKHSKYISFRATGQDRFTQAKTVGENYTEERIRKRIAEDKSMILYRGLITRARKLEINFQV